MSRLVMAFCAAFLAVVSSLDGQITIETVPVEDAGNAPDAASGFGTVTYEYRIATTEVTNDQYATFLNSVANVIDTHSLYNPMMGSDPRGGIQQLGASGNLQYQVKPNMGNKPANFVSFWDAARFANWLQNGQTSGLQTSGTTEDGSYFLGGVTNPLNVNVFREPTASIFIASENEWYKAAYHDPRDAAQGGPSGDDHYWSYPTASDIAPVVAQAAANGDISNPGPNVANYLRGADWGGQDGNVTSVGTAGGDSTSFWGTYDQGGNVWEWNDTIPTPFTDYRGIRGGTWFSGSGDLRPFRRGQGEPTLERDFLGFRVASVAPRTVSCDFDGDGDCDIVDLNSLLATGPIFNGVPVIAGQTDQFDLNGDGRIDLSDRGQWLSLAASENGFSSPYIVGDANLDGRVDGSDFNFWNSHKFTFSTDWDRGDFTGDGVIDGSDFNLWSANKFTSSGTSTVPEPWLGVWFMSTGCGWALVRYRRYTKGTVK